MRKIKFRIWIPEIKSWQTTENTEFAPFRVLADPKKYGYIISQFTGLLDRNKKEIYEGDIVKSLDLLGRTKHIDYVIWNEYEAKFAKSGALSGTLFGGEQIEIIGNIYENPELLK